MSRTIVDLGIAFVIFIGMLFPLQGRGADYRCTPTPPDALGPYYQPGAPVRSEVGQGYTLTGAVRSAEDCAPIPGAKIEFWLAGPQGEYKDRYRATVFADSRGAYRFESVVPGRYFSRPPHIHLRVSADGFRTLVTQHYPEESASAAQWDLVLVPAR